MQCITVKYLGPTNYRGARMKASAQAGSVTLNYQYGLNIADNASAAAKAYAAKYGWHGDWVGGQDTKGDWQFVNVSWSPVSERFTVERQESPAA